MGIPHLFTFVTKRLSNGLIDIDIIQEIEKWTRQNNVNPTIVIDFPAFTHAICDNRRDAFVGGRYEHCLKKTEQFLNVFKQIGVNLVFFEDGPVQVEKSDNVINRQNRKYEEIFSILDELYKGTPVDEMANKYEINLHGSLPAGIRAIARTFGKFQKSYHNECDKEVVAYAVMVNAMAIISDDTDFLIYEGNWNYWSSRHINFSSLTTKNYNKIYLKDHLKLIEEEMPLLATLAGNDIISKDLLDRFHRFLGNPWYKFENISRYIIKNFRNVNGNEPEYIARKVFGNTNNLPEYTELVRKSLNSYNIRMLDLNVNNGNNFLNHIRNIENDCYAYLLDLARSCTISYFDVRTPDFEKYPSLSLDLIRRQLGIILHHKNDRTLIRHIYCYQNGRYVYETLHPEYPPISVPNLEDLYNADKNVELKMVKLRLLTWVLSDRLDINTIITIDRKYFCVCLTLFYMVENKFITVREADIFLHMIDTVYEHFSTIINLPQLDHIDSRAFQIIFLYDKVYQHVTHALSNCGLFELIEHNHMDGLYFHYAYNKMRGSTNNEQNNDRLSHLRLQNNVNPTIVIDFSAFIHAISDNRRDALVGGRYAHCFKKTEQFLNVFKQLGVNLVFFEDGPAQVEKSDRVLQRQNRRNEEIFSILDELYKGTRVDELVNKYEIRLNGGSAGIRAIARTFGKFQKSYHNECDKELVAYAVMVNAMAIISDDTDFLIYEGNWNYWSSRHINFSSLTTKNYNKTYLKDRLNLTEKEMPLLATLAGNDVISKDLLDRFHRFLGNPLNTFENISRYIIKNFRNIDGNDPEYIARKVFGNTNNLPEYTELVRKSLNSYNIRMLDGNVNNGNNFLNHIRNIENNCYAYLLDLARFSRLSYFDVRTPEFEKYPSLALDVVRRQLGIILHHKNDSTLTRHVYCYQNGQYVYKAIRPEYPPISVPNLDDLYNADKNDELKMIKLRLLTWVLSTRLDINTIITIDRKYLCVCLSLFYMVENKFITVQEADIFLHMIDTVYEKFSTIVDLPQLDRLDPRAFQILFLYDKIYQKVTRALSNCGLFELIEHNHMDGLYFHYAFNKMLGSTNSELQDDNGRLSHLRLYEIF